jgi:hypothetical protein
MKRTGNEQELVDETRPSGSPFTILDFFIKSSFLAIVLTLLPVAGLVVLWELKLTTPPVMISWLMATLFWTFFTLLKLSRKVIE